jgi:superfamily I DNA/RNA helicase
MNQYDLTAPWNQGVRGEQVLPLINDDAPVMRVEAGPGTGKTFGLARRVHRILARTGLDVDGKKVLIVAFNRVIASDLRQGILKRLADADINKKPEIWTLHGFCRKLLAGKEKRLLLPHEREFMIADVLFAHAKLQDDYGTAPKASQKLRLHEAGHENHPVLWQACDRWLHRHSASLVGDLPNEVLKHLRGGDFEDARFDHVIVDEFQDLSSSEQELVVRLRADGGQLLALGDPRQSIYAFRGNNRLGLGRLEELTQQPVHDVPMTECQRCPATIVLAANELTALDEATPMEPANERSANVHVVHWKTVEAEAKGMAKTIAASVQARPAEDHLVMVTRRQFGYALRDELSKLVPQLTINLSFSESILELWPVREAFSWLSLLADPDPATWRAWLGYRNSPPATTPLPNKRNADAYARVLHGAEDNITPSVVLALAKAESPPAGSGGKALWERAKRYAALQAGHDWQGMGAATVLEAAFSPGMWTTPDDKTSAAADFNVLMQHTLAVAADLPGAEDPGRRNVILKKVIEDLRYAIATREPLHTTQQSDLHVATLWGAKGLTADHVYVLGLCAEVLPGKRPDDYPGTDLDHRDEQRRLFYVSLTRSKDTLVLSRPQQVKRGRARQLKLPIGTAGSEHWATLEVSPFLGAIPTHFPDSVPGDIWRGCVAA